MKEKQIDYREYARQMRENCVRVNHGDIICSGELWEEIANIIEGFAGYRKHSENTVEDTEMLEIIEKAREEYANDITDHTENEYIREALLNANYRKQGEVIDEFVKRLKEAPIKCAFPLFGLSTKEEIAIHFNDIMLQVGDAIDSIEKEMKGGEEG